MQLNDFRSAWKQFKLSHAMQHLEASEILSLIETADDVNKTKSQTLLVNLVMFIIITFFCQGG